LSRLSRIINVGDLTFTAVDATKGTGYPVRPGTSVSGTCTITTFFSKPDDSGPAPAAAPAPAAPPAGAQGKGD
jgi:hypothetical protein